MTAAVESHATATTAAPPEWGRLQRLSLLAGVVGIAAFVVLFFVGLAAGMQPGAQQFFLTYLVAYLFVLMFPLGSMVLLMIQYLTSGRWGIHLRKIFEASTRTLPLLAVLFIPIVVNLFLGDTSIYWWTTPQPESAPEDTKSRINEYLNIPFFIARAVIYFLIWGTFIFLLNRWSAAADRSQVPAEQERYRDRLKNISGPGLMVYALIVTFAATDWAMSIEKSWASTMFPVIFAIVQILGSWAFAIVVFMYLSTRAPLAETIKPVDKINLGSLLLAFTLFWTYISFSQFLLVWVGNLPEEIPFYLLRVRGGWQYVGVALAIFHFAAPFLLLLFRDIKLHPGRLTAVAILLLVMCVVDVVWWIEPIARRENNAFPLYLLMDAGAVVGLFGIWGWLFLGQLKSGPLLPASEAWKLEEAH